jgi:uncharacterized protein YfaS (alpha-2-macroglobulin family)
MMAANIRNYLYSLVLLASFSTVLTGCGEQQESSDTGKPPSSLTAQATATPEKEDAASAEKTSSKPADDGTTLTILDVAEHAHDGGSALAVVLSSPLDPADNHQDYLNVALNQDGQVGRVDGSWVLSDSGRILYFPHIEPETEYVVTVYQGLHAKDGRIVTEPVSKTIKTRDVRPSLSFSSQGSLLPAKVSQGLPIVAININDVHVNFHRVKPEALMDFFGFARGGGLKEFWRLHLLDDTSTLVYSGQYELNPPKNKRREFTIKTSEIPALKEPGVYVAVMRPAGSYQTDLADATYFTITDLGIHARFYGDRLDVHLSSLASGEAVKGANVTLLDANGETLDEGRSTPEGLMTFSGMESKEKKSARFIAASSGQYFTLLDLQRPALDLSDFNVGKRPHLPTELFLYSPRNLYRPNEAITVSGLLRDHDGGRTKELPLKARFLRPDGEASKYFTWQPEEGGYYEYRYALPENTPTGRWYLEVTLPGGQTTGYPFQVEEFLPERMKLTLHGDEAKTPVTAPAEPITIPVNGEYLYGAPAAGNRLETEVRIRHFREPLEQWKDYQFGDLADQQGLEQFDLDAVELDQNGKTKLVINSRWQKNRSPLDVHVTASLFESGGRPVTRSRSHLVWPGDALIGVRPGFGDENPQENSEASFQVILAHRDGSLLAGRKIEAQLINEDRQYFWEWSNGEGWHYEYSQSEYPVETRTLESDEQAVTLKLPVAYGHYRLELTDTETGVRTNLRFHAGRDWYYWWQREQVESDQAARPNAVALSFDKPRYKAGETATLTIVPPAAGEAVVLLESDRPLWSKRLKVAREGAQVEIPLDKGWDRHDIYASVVMLRSADAKERIAPHRSFGLAHLPLDRENRRLQVAIEAPDKIKPEQEKSVTVRVTNLPPEQTARVTLAAVDVGVLSIARFETPDPFEGMFGQRRYSVNSRDIYDQIMDLGSGDTARLRFGGDGEAELARGGDRPLTEVQIVSLFSGAVAVDEKGEAQIPLTFPDFNGKVRLMAVAFGDNRYGSAEREMIVASPLVTQIAMPRFMAPGDQTTLALDLHNLSGKEADLKLKLDANGPISVKDGEQALKLADGEKRILRFSTVAGERIGASDIRLQIDGLTDENGNPSPFSRSWKLGVRPAWPAVTRRLQGVLGKDEQFQLPASSLNGLLADTVQVLLSVDDSPGLELQNQLRNLLQYPYGCLEQTSSRVFPLLFADRQNLGSVGIKSPFKDDTDRLEQIDKGLARIFSMQRANGSYGLWSRQSEEEHWLTAYVADLLLEAQSQGITVPQERLDSTLKRLKNYLNQSGPLFGQRDCDSPPRYAFATKAYAAYVLARVKQAPLGSLRRIYAQENDNVRMPLALLQLGIALKEMGDTRQGDAAITRALEISPERDQYLGDYGSDLRDTAAMISLLLKHDIERKRAGTLALDLAGMLHQRNYLSTQERNALFFAGLQLETVESSEWRGSLKIGLDQEEIQQSKRLIRLFRQKAAAKGIRLSSRNDSDLYFSALVNGYSAEPPEAVSNDMQIARNYFNNKGQLVTPESLEEGETLVVHLVLKVDDRNPDLLVADLLPAGLEPENPALPDSIQLDEIEIEGKTIRQWREENPVKYEEYRDDRYVAAIEVRSWGGSHHLFYGVRAVTPGRYRVPPPFVEDMYAPEEHAIGTATPSWIEVKGK